MFPKYLFSIFWHYCTHTAILFVYSNVHKNSFILSYFLQVENKKCESKVQYLLIFKKYFKNVPKFVLHFLLASQFCICDEISINIAFSFIFLLQAENRKIMTL